MRAFASYARLPLEDVAISLTDASGRAIALALTDENGMLDAPVAVTVPDTAESLIPEASDKPYGTVELYAYLPKYNAVRVVNLQVFSGVTSVQDLRMVPQSEFPSQGDRTQVIDTLPQEL